MGLAVMHLSRQGMPAGLTFGNERLAKKPISAKELAVLTGTIWMVPMSK